VTVLYLADDPRQEAIIDRGIWLNWAIPGIIFSVAVFLVWLMVFILRSSTSPGPRPVAGGLLKSPS
jgi:hypothetical protein